MDFLYRKAGRKPPDRAPVLLAAVHAEAEALILRTKKKAASLVLGGRSMGGRICSMAVTDGLPAAGLVLISYPLHPPGKPEKLRTEHLPNLTLPCLFIHGTKDPFGSPAELQVATAAIPGAVTHIWVDGRGHDLKSSDALVAAAVVDWLSTIR